MALTLSSTIKDLAGYTLWNTAYASLDTTKKALIDNFGAQCLAKIQKYAQWWEQAGASQAPDEWDHWLTWEVIHDVGHHARPERVEMYRRRLESAIDSALSVYAKSDANASAIVGQNIHVKGLRFYVMLHTARRKDAFGNRLLVGPDVVDAEIQWALNYVWERLGWAFRKRQVKITIAANGTVTDDLSGTEEIDSIASLRFYYDDDHTRSIQWLDADEMAQRIAHDTEESDTGRPWGFRLQGKPGGFTWKFTPAPDQQYTARGEVFVFGPGIPTDSPWPDLTNSTTTTEFARLPLHFGPVVRDLVLGRVLKNHGITADVYDSAIAQIDTLLVNADDPGRSDDQATIDDQNNDVFFQYGQYHMGGRI